MKQGIIKVLSANKYRPALSGMRGADTK